LAQPTASRSPTASNSAGSLLTNDLYARSLWQLHGGASAPLPERWPGVARDAVVGVANAALGTIVLSWSGAHPAAVMQDWEAHWFQPILAEWRSGRYKELILVAGNTEYRLTSAARWRFWSRATPWWETLLA
jgi:hypothetical protein